MIIKRPEEQSRIGSGKKWTLVYGRRKTGKTFLVENFIPYDDYFFVNRDRTIISKKTNTQIGYDTLIEILRRELDENKTIVIDEFHRLGDPFLDLLHSMKKTGRLLLLTSTLFLAKKLLAEKSPLLGIFYEVQVRLISLDDCLNALRGYGLDNRQLVESAIMLREPIAIDYFNKGEDVRKTFARLLLGSMNTVPALVGEIFLEEEKSLSATYEGIIRSIANGKAVSGEISSSLYSRGLVPKDDPSTIQPYLNNLVKIGILKRVSVYDKRKFMYKIASPLVRLFFYADEKYGIAERQMSDAEAGRILDEVLPRIVEDNIREYLAAKFGLNEAVLEAKDYEIDGVLTRFKKPIILLEVKWKDKISIDDIKNVEQELNKITAKKRILFVQNKSGLNSKIIDIMDVSDLPKLIAVK